MERVWRCLCSASIHLIAQVSFSLRLPERYACPRSDLWNAPEVDGMVYRTSVRGAGEAAQTAAAYQARHRLGEATDLGGTVTFHFDNAREESYR